MKSHAARPDGASSNVDVAPRNSKLMTSLKGRPMSKDGMDRRAFLVGGLVAGGLPSLLAERPAADQQAGPAAARSVQILVFDTFGTVVDWRSSVIAEGEKLGRDKGLNVDWASFADAWRGGYGPAMNRVRSGQLPWTKLDALHRMTLDDLLVRFKVNGLTEDE